MELATYIGISIADFWEITPRELMISTRSFNNRKNNEIEEYKIKLENERRLLTVQAIQISRWVWQKTLNVEKLLAELDNANKPKQPMSNEAMLNQAKILNTLFGGEVENIDGNEK